MVLGPGYDFIQKMSMHVLIRRRGGNGRQLYEREGEKVCYISTLRKHKQSRNR